MATSTKQAVADNVTNNVTNNVTDISSAKPRSKKKPILIATALLAVLAGGGVWGWMTYGPNQHVAVAKPAPPALPVFVELENFTVNLAGEHILQVSITLQVKRAEDADQIKLYMPQVKSRLLMLMSTKNAEELNTADGKKTLSAEIAAQLRMPFVKGLAAPEMAGVFFTAFVIQ